MLLPNLLEKLMIRLETKDFIGARETKVETGKYNFYGWVNILPETTKRKEMD